MTHIDLRPLVLQAISTNWQVFAQRHPHLAEVVDQALLAEQATDLLAADPDYQAALARADAAGWGAEQVVPVVTRFVRQWLGALLP